MRSKAYTPQMTVTGVMASLHARKLRRRFSAIGYFFARDLQREIKVPVGIIAEALRREHGGVVD